MVVAVAGLLVASCGDSGNTTAGTTGGTTSTTAGTSAVPTTEDGVAGATSTSEGEAAGECADVVAATIERSGDGFTVSATVSSADTGWEKYADLWQIRTEDGEVLGERVLTHPHENEQPFTRSLVGVEIPDDVDRVVLVAHDLVAGFCGDSYTAEVPRS
jgi:hypothetical protein